MQDRGRRATDLQTPERRGTGSLETPLTRLEEGVGAFPLFSEPPFSNWSQRRGQQWLRRHPGNEPRILLWDEVGTLAFGGDSSGGDHRSCA